MRMRFLGYNPPVVAHESLGEGCLLSSGVAGVCCGCGVMPQGEPRCG